MITASFSSEGESFRARSDRGYGWQSIKHQITDQQISNLDMLTLFNSGNKLPQKVQFRVDSRHNPNLVVPKLITFALWPSNQPVKNPNSSVFVKTFHKGADKQVNQFTITRKDAAWRAITIDDYTVTINLSDRKIRRKWGPLLHQYLAKFPGMTIEFSFHIALEKKVDDFVDIMMYCSWEK